MFGCNGKGLTVVHAWCMRGARARARALARANTNTHYHRALVDARMQTHVTLVDERREM